MIPSLSICVNNACNLRCAFCSRDTASGVVGENLMPSVSPLTNRDFAELIAMVAEEGVDHFRLTGGEPFATRDRLFALLRAIEETAPVDILVNTNGTLISPSDLACLAEISSLRLKFSLHSLKGIGADQGAAAPDEVMTSIRLAATHHIPVEVNCVVTRDNLTEVPAIWRFCMQEGISLKLLDLYERSRAYWEAQYVTTDSAVDLIANTVEPSDIVHLSSGRGIPMRRLRPVGNLAKSGAQVVVKDMNAGSTYLTGCRSCDQFPCGEGVFTLILDSDGRFFRCHRIAEPIAEHHGNARIRRDIRAVLSEYASSSFFDARWST